HLFKVVLVPPAEVARLVDPEVIDGALEKVGRFDFGHFKEQVLPYLSAGMIELYRQAEAFERLKSEVEEPLLRMR
ncbi:MAG: hypothetical protein AAB339_07015, partial [Elusimicrobiota bacterium]